MNALAAKHMTTGGGGTARQSVLAWINLDP